MQIAPGGQGFEFRNFNAPGHRAFIPLNGGQLGWTVAIELKVPRSSHPGRYIVESDRNGPPPMIKRVQREHRGRSNSQKLRRGRETERERRQAFRSIYQISAVRSHVLLLPITIAIIVLSDPVMDISTLQSRISTAYIPPHRTQLHPRMHPFAAPLSKPFPPQPAPHPHLKWWSLAAALLALLFLLYLVSLARGVHLSSRFSDPKPKGYGVVIHVGRAVTRARVFEFLNEGRVVPFADGLGSESMTIRTGLAEFAVDAENAGNSLLGLLGYAKERVPKAEWKDTRVRLVATGQLGTDAREAVLKSCRNVLRSSGFMFKDELAMRANLVKNTHLKWHGNAMQQKCESETERHDCQR
ncbi:hypothetical protein ACLOJK_000148 [Asimina triloba]